MSTKTAGRQISRQKARAKAKRRRSRRAPVGWIAFAVVAAAAMVAVVVTSGGDGTGGSAFGSDVSVTGEALPDFPSGGAPDPAAGALAPEMRGTTFDGDAIAITRDGTPKVIMFIAHWCHVCQKEVPVVQAWLAEKGAPAGIEVVSVSTSVSEVRGNFPPKAWLEREGWTVPVLADDESSTALGAYGMSSFPAFVFLDARGRVAARAVGALPVATIEQFIEQAKAAA